MFFFQELGRAEAGLAAKSRPPVMTSPHFVAQYFTSFSEDPILKWVYHTVHKYLKHTEHFTLFASRSLEKESEADVDEKVVADSNHGYEAARECLKTQNYDNIIK